MTSEPTLPQQQYWQRKNCTASATIDAEACRPVVDALAEIGPATRRELEYETLLSEGQLTRRLGRLEDAGVVERQRHPEDGRKYVYEVVVDAAALFPERQTAERCYFA